MSTGWRTVRLAHCAEIRVSNVDKLSVGGQVPVRLCNYTDVYKSNIVDDSFEYMRATAPTEQVRRFALREGDTVITKDSETAEDIGVAAIVGNVGSDVVCGYHLAIVRPNVDVKPRFLYWVLNSRKIAHQWREFATGVTRVGLRAGDIRRAQINLPDRDAQRAIANYLDRETAQIDVLIEKQQQLIATLRERRTAVVWGSLSTVDGVKDKLGRWTRIGNGSTPARDRTEYWSGGTFPWLNSSVVNQELVTEAEQFVTRTALDECHLPIVTEGSILVGLTGQGKTRGMATLLRTTATVNQHLAYLTPVPSKWADKYLLWLLRSLYPVLRALSDENGSTKGGLTCGDLKELRVTRPSLKEQQIAVSVIESSAHEIDKLIMRAAQLIELASERRSALITAAVTGQIDVRSAG